MACALVKGPRLNRCSPTANPGLSTHPELSVVRKNPSREERSQRNCPSHPRGPRRRAEGLSGAVEAESVGLSIRDPERATAILQQRRGISPVADSRRARDSPRWCSRISPFAHGAAARHGATPKVVQGQLRHSDARTTLEIYGHVVGDAQREAVEKVAALLHCIGPKSANRDKWIQ
jgi:hypothetical protein